MREQPVMEVPLLADLEARDAVEAARLLGEERDDVGLLVAEDSVEPEDVARLDAEGDDLDRRRASR
jgi:hypothetical protein